MAWNGRQTALKCHTIDEFKTYLSKLELRGWRPAGMTLHNTATPNRKRWDAQPGEVWLRNLKSYYVGKGWSAGPHAFCDGNDIWVMTDFNTRGVHSPSYNASRLGIEMVADFNVEDDDSGIGLKVKLQTAQLFAACHAFFGWEPSTTSIKLHKEDPATDHDCPGKDIDKIEFIRLVQQYMGDGGDHDPDVTEEPALNLPGTVINVPAGDFLNLRESAGAGSKALRQLQNGTPLVVMGSALNGATRWLRVTVEGVVGWVASAFVDFVGEKKWVKLDNITATVFGGVGDTQPSAYPPFAFIDPNKLGCALPYKYRGTRPHVKVIGPGGSAMLEVVDLGPWNLSNPEYVIQGKRPMVEQQYKDHARAQNGRVPSNDAGVDLTPAAARAVGISGKGKVSIEIEVMT
jgi:hypothetical protein